MRICKGQLISERLFDILNFPKNQWKIWQISALEYKKWLNHKIKATNYLQIILDITYYRKVPLFCWFDHFLYSRAEICQIFRWFFGKFKISKRHSEINWPLAHRQKKSVFYGVSWNIRADYKWHTKHWHVQTNSIISMLQYWKPKKCSKTNIALELISLVLRTSTGFIEFHFG